MSRDAGKAQQAKRQIPKNGKGRRPLDHEQEALTLENKAEALALANAHHTQALSHMEAHDIQISVEQLSLEADRLRQVSRNPHKTRSRPLDTVEEDPPYSHNTSSEGEEEASSRLGSSDTQPYAEQPTSSPFNQYPFGKSPNQAEQPLSAEGNPQLFNTTPLVSNPQRIIAPPTTSPGITAVPIDPMMMIQSMFSQQAEANKRKQTNSYSYF